MFAEKHGTILLGHQFYIEVEETGKKWAVPDSLLQEGDSGIKWLQVSASTYGCVTF